MLEVHVAYDVLTVTALCSVLPGFIEQDITVCSIAPPKHVITNTNYMSLIVCKHYPLFVAAFL